MPCASANAFTRSGSRAATATTSTSRRVAGSINASGAMRDAPSTPKRRRGRAAVLIGTSPFDGKRVRGERLVQSQASRNGDSSPLMVSLDTVEAHGRRTAPSRRHAQPAGFAVGVLGR